MTGMSYSFANNTDGINKNVTTSFEKDFQNAREVRWDTKKVFLKATFVLNGQVTFAYYSQNGELMAVTRNILSSQLPINQLMNLNKNYDGYWITDLFELSADNQTSYYITLENADSKLVLKSSGSEGWSVYRKETKM